MDNIKNIQSVFLIGIGGIGMSALARYFQRIGKNVAGYDARQTALTQELEAEGIAVQYEDLTQNADPNAQLVIYTPAVKTSAIMDYYQQKGMRLYKRAEVLGMITSAGPSYTVAGTHGKTTTSTMLAHVLFERSEGVTAFLGGISVNYNTNFLYSQQSDEFVVEADEYDRSFLQLHPDSIVLTSLDADHLDIYENVEAMRETYDEYVRLLPSDGILLVKHELNYASDVSAKKYTYSLQNDYADVYADHIQTDHGSYHFEVVAFGERYEDFVLNMGGMHNVENALAVIATALKLGIKVEDLRASLARFSGVKRRFQYVYKDLDKVYIDDYAHHPEELENLIKSARSLFSGRKLRLVFQPHLFSRTRDFADEFARVLDMADDVVLMDIYPAREKPIEGVSAEWLLGKMNNQNKHIMSAEAVQQWVRATRPDLLITAGAGSIDELVEPIREIYQSEK